MDIGIEEYEERSKKIFFAKMVNYYTKLGEDLEIFKEGVPYVIEENLEFPNIGITANNKFVELIQEFKKNGLSIFASEYKKTKSISSSLIGDSIMNDIKDKLSEGSNKIDDIYVMLEKIVIREYKKGLEEDNKKFKIFKKKSNNKEEIVTKEEIEEIKKLYNQYENIDNEIWKYNIQDNVIDSIVKYFRKKYFRPSVVPALVENIEPELKKLGLGDLIPKLKTEIINEYKKDLPKNYEKNMKKEYINVYVPKFNDDEKGSNEDR